MLIALKVPRSGKTICEKVELAYNPDNQQDIVFGKGKAAMIFFANVFFSDDGQMICEKVQWPAVKHG